MPEADKSIKGTLLQEGSDAVQLSTPQGDDQGLRGKATVQSDIYAFGGTLHYLLTGVEPEALSSSRPKDLVPDMSDELSEFVESCTQMEAAERFQTRSQLLPVLKRLAAQSVVV